MKYVTLVVVHIKFGSSVPISKFFQIAFAKVPDQCNQDVVKFGIHCLCYYCLLFDDEDLMKTYDELLK